MSDEQKPNDQNDNPQQQLSPLERLAIRVAPVVENILSTAIPGADVGVLKNASPHVAAAVLQQLNVGVASKIIVPTVGLFIKEDVQPQDFEDDTMEAYKTGALPIWISSHVPLPGDFILLDQRIPVQWQPALVRRTHYPYDGGHITLIFKLFVNDKEEADQAWEAYTKLLGIQETNMQPVRGTEGEEREEAPPATEGPKIVRP